MNTFQELTALFAQRFAVDHFPEQPRTLYDPNRYFLGLGGKRIRPVACLMGNELFNNIEDDAYHVAAAIELFHNFTLVHDDIMDKAPLRRGLPTVHEKYGVPTALLAGDVMLVAAYDALNRINTKSLRSIIHLFNKTARQVCEGQQQDMDFETEKSVPFAAYENMIDLKTSVLLGASLQMGAILGGAGEGNQQLLYDFGRKLGLAFQVQDDYLDAFGDPQKFGKQVGGDIRSNKKTFLLIHALETADASSLQHIGHLLANNDAGKVNEMLAVYRSCGVDAWAQQLKQNYMQDAFDQLEEIAVLTKRKEPLRQLAHFLLDREH